MTAAVRGVGSRTLERLAAPPQPGGTHLWLAQIAGGLCKALAREQCSGFLRRCTDEFVKHRAVPDREIDDAVELAFGEGSQKSGVRSQRGLEWPAANAEAIGRVLAAVEAAFDPAQGTDLGPREVLPRLFRPGELVCTGAESDRAVVRPVEAVVADAGLMQFVVPNPMKGVEGVNKAGKASKRCQANVALRRYLVAEFDDPALGRQKQAQLATALGSKAPLVMVVDSGGKSLHCWFWVEGQEEAALRRFFACACLLGADPTRWDPCGWLRMPGGMRVRSDGRRVQQRVLYWAGEIGLHKRGGPIGKETGNGPRIEPA